MTWNAFPHDGAHSGPAPPDSDAFWDLIHSMGPDHRAGSGVDHADPSTNPNPDHGFHFGSDGFEAWSCRRGRRDGWGRRGRHGTWLWAAGQEPGGHGRRWDGPSHARSSDEELSGDDTKRDGLAGGGDGEHDAGNHGGPDILRAAEKNGHGDGDGVGENDVPDPPVDMPLPPFPSATGRGDDIAGRSHHCHHHHHPYGHLFAGRRGHHGRHGPHPPHAPASGNPFDFDDLVECARNLLVTQVYERWGKSQGNKPQGNQASSPRDTNHRGAAGSCRPTDDCAPDSGDSHSFVPPVDVFNTADNWTVHVALPGAKKEDVTVNWDAKKGQLAITGVVHRPGDEAFLAGMVSGERRVGLFERRVALPPAESGNKDDVDGLGITARMENGVLVVVVPKAEKEWTEVRKVDIE